MLSLFDVLKKEFIFEVDVGLMDGCILIFPLHLEK